MATETPATTFVTGAARFVGSELVKVLVAGRHRVFGLTVNGPYYKYQVARIFIQAGQLDRALDLIEPLVSKPGDVTPGWLRIDSISTPVARQPEVRPADRCGQVAGPGCRANDSECRRTGTLDDTAASRDFVSLLPPTLTLEDDNGT